MQHDLESCATCATVAACDLSLQCLAACRSYLVAIGCCQELHHQRQARLSPRSVSTQSWHPVSAHHPCLQPTWVTPRPWSSTLPPPPTSSSALRSKYGRLHNLACLPACLPCLSLPCSRVALQESCGVKPNLIRVSVGIEHIEDIKADFRQAIDIAVAK